jgi:hypothetical protein
MVKTDIQPATRKTNSGLDVSTVAQGGGPKHNSRMTSRHSGSAYDSVSCECGAL